MYVCLTFRFPIFIAVAVGEKLIEAIILIMTRTYEHYECLQQARVINLTLSYV